MINCCKTGPLSAFKPAILLILVLANLGVLAQTYPLPDENLKNKLLRDYPWVMDNDELNIAAANSYPGPLDLSHSNISNPSGLEYFTNIWSLDLGFNKLDSIPQLSSMRKLTHVFLSFNQLKSLPDLTPLNGLREIQVHYNQLKALPYLNNLPFLSKLYCNDNQLEILPDISNLVNLTQLIIGNNRFHELPDFSAFPNLIQLHIHQTGTDTIKGLSKLKNLEVLYAWGNEIQSVKGLDSLENLRIISVFDNNLREIPYLLNKPDLIQIEFSNNYLSFEDIIPLKPFSFFPKLQYAPQKSLSLTSIEPRDKAEVSLNVEIDNTWQSTYLWYKDHELIETTNFPSLEFSGISPKDEGIYHVTVTNPQLPGLVLESNTASVSVLPCLELNKLNVTVLNKDCNTGVDVDLSKSIIDGGNLPITSILKGNSKMYSSGDLRYSGIEYGIYSLIISDSKGCEATASLLIEKPDNCQDIFTPNGDGFKDTYVIDIPGMIKIYDVNRNLVKEIYGPAEWDGTKSDGSPADAGFYAIVTENDNLIRLTLIR